jgi:hypothetical protein
MPPTHPLLLARGQHRWPPLPLAKARSRADPKPQGGVLVLLRVLGKPWIQKAQFQGFIVLRCLLTKGLAKSFKEKGKKKKKWQPSLICQKQCSKNFLNTFCLIAFEKRKKNNLNKSNLPVT